MVDTNKLFLISGPCVIEAEDIMRRTAEGLKELSERLDIQLVFKSSFMKDNRSSVDYYHGPGLDEGLKMLQMIKTEYELPVLSDVHYPAQVAPAAEVLDVIQIPAYLCMQTSLVVAAAKTGKAVNVKKGQFLSPEDTPHIVQKIRSAGNDSVMLTERGTSFGYRTLVVDYAGFPTMRETRAPLIFDATHSVQRPGGRGTSSGGDRRHVRTLSRAAVAAGVDVAFAEVHEAPDEALSDSATQLDLATFEALVTQWVALRGCAP